MCIACLLPVICTLKGRSFLQGEKVFANWLQACCLCIPRSLGEGEMSDFSLEAYF